MQLHFHHLPTLLVLSLIVDGSSFTLAPAKPKPATSIQQKIQRQQQQQRRSWGSLEPASCRMSLSDESYLDSLRDYPVEVDVETNEEEEVSTVPVVTGESNSESECLGNDDPDISLNLDDNEYSEEPSSSFKSAPTTTNTPQPSAASAPPTPEQIKEVEDSIFWLSSLGAITGRGEYAVRAQKESAAKVLKTLEASNPTDMPTKSPKSHGRWELIYAETHSFRASPFFLAARAVCTTADEAKQFAWFCDMHRAALAVSQIEAVRQIVTSDGRFVSEFEVRAGAVPFLSDLTPFSYSGGVPLTVTGAIVSSADVSPNTAGTGWEVSMDTVEIKGSNLPGVRQILDAGLKIQSRPLSDWLEENNVEYTKPTPVLQITYLDDMFRISRDQDGNAYCYVKTSTSTELTDYSRVDPDLGIVNLLSGLNDAVTKFYI
jgi:hypothetical protein